MNNRRIPKVDNRVWALGHTGVFVVSKVFSPSQTVQITNLASPTLVLIVDYKHLDYLDELDESQTAARIVREATKDR